MREFFHSGQETDGGISIHEALAGKGLVDRNALCGTKFSHHEIVHLGEEEEETYDSERERRVYTLWSSGVECALIAC